MPASFRVIDDRAIFLGLQDGIGRWYCAQAEPPAWEDDFDPRRHLTPAAPDRTFPSLQSLPLPTPALAPGVSVVAFVATAPGIFAPVQVADSAGNYQTGPWPARGLLISPY